MITLHQAVDQRSRCEMKVDNGNGIVNKQQLSFLLPTLAICCKLAIIILTQHVK